LGICRVSQIQIIGYLQGVPDTDNLASTGCLKYRLVVHRVS